MVATITNTSSTCLLYAHTQAILLGLVVFHLSLVSGAPVEGTSCGNPNCASSGHDPSSNKDDDKATGGAGGGKGLLDQSLGVQLGSGFLLGMAIGVVLYGLWRGCWAAGRRCRPGNSQGSAP